MLKGDVHRLYKKLRHSWPVPPEGPCPELDHVREIVEYYGQFSPNERALLLSWAKKEESGIGLIPAALSGIPLLGLLFAPLIQAPIKEMPPWVWMVLWAGGAVALVAGIYIHHRQKAYTTLHIHILQQLADRKLPTAHAGRYRVTSVRQAVQSPAREGPAPPTEPNMPLQQQKGPEH